MADSVVVDDITQTLIFHVNIWFGLRRSRQSSIGSMVSTNK
jgi:hypothetical protein